MICKATILVAAQMLALVAQATASETTTPLTSKVAHSDLVAIIKIQAVERGKIYGAAQDFKMDAVVIDRIKGDSPDTIVVSAVSTSFTTESGLVFSTAGFSDYGIEPGKSYIAYLQKDTGGQYNLGWNSNQYLEEISADGLMVNDVGQTSKQVSLRLKVWKLRALALVLTQPGILSSALATLALVAIWMIRRRRNRRLQRQLTSIQAAEPDVPPND